MFQAHVKGIPLPGLLPMHFSSKACPQRKLLAGLPPAVSGISPGLCSSQPRLPLLPFNIVCNFP